jgi:hypothetical protein
VTRLLASAVALVVFAGLASGCGWLAATRPLAADDPPRLSRPAFVSQVEAACARRARALGSLPRPRAAAQRRGFFARVAAVERAEAVALASLRPPRRDEREFGRLLAASVELAEIAERFVVAVARSDGHERRRALADAERASAAYDRAARRLRLACRQSA